MQPRLDPHVDLEVEAVGESDLGHVHPVGTHQIADGLLLGSVHREVGWEVKRIDHELYVDLGEHWDRHVRRLHGAHPIDFVVFEGQSVERTLRLFFVQFYFHKV